MKWLLFTLNAFWLTVSDSFLMLGFSLCEGVMPSLAMERSQLLQRGRPGRGMAAIRMEAAATRKVRSAGSPARSGLTRLSVSASRILCR